MRQIPSVLVIMLLAAACGGSQPSVSERPVSSRSEEGAGSSPVARQEPKPTAAAEDAGESANPVRLKAGEENEFELRDSETAGDARGVRPSEIEPTKTQAAMRFFVVDRDKGPIPGIVIKLTGSSGTSHYTGETDAKGYAEVLVPVGQTYELEYLSLGRRKISAKVPVPDEPNQNIKLTLRYKRHDQRSEASQAGPAESQEPRFVLTGVRFDTGKATIREESHARLDEVVEYMTHKKSARIRIAGHTDNVGDPKANMALSKKRAEAVRDYLVEEGIDGSRIEAVGYGDTRPIAPNDTEAGRQKNRRIEAVEL